MITVKRLLLRGVTHKALAQASQTSIPYISKILAGKHRPGRDKAINLARCANQLTGYAVFDASDFNDELHNLDNVCSDVMIRVYSLLWKQTKVISAGELLEEHSHNLSLMIALNNLVYDGASQSWGGYNLDLQPDDEPTRW